MSTLFGDWVEIDAVHDDNDVLRPVNVRQVPFMRHNTTTTQSINQWINNWTISIFIAANTITSKQRQKRPKEKQSDPNQGSPFGNDYRMTE